MRRTVIALALLVCPVLGDSAVAGDPDRQSARFVALMFSDGYLNEFQSRSFTFWVSRTFYRVRWSDATPLICEAGEGYRYSCYRVQLQPRDPPAYVVFGVPRSHRRAGTYIFFGTDIDRDGNLVDETCFRIADMVTEDNAQMIESDQR